MQLPPWVERLIQSKGTTYLTVEDRMWLAIELAQRNVEHGTGGPFGAAVFALDTGVLLAPGVNLVVPARCSVAHAEIVALTIAQQVAQAFDLGAEGLPRYQLVTSTEPCAMCLGAVPWSGVRSLVCGARDGDARAVGFDEGAKVANWVQELEGRGIEVLADVLRDQAVAVLQSYAARGGLVYNARQGE